MLSTSVGPRAFTSSVRPCRPALASRRATTTIVNLKPTKAQDFRGLSNEEVAKKISDLKVELASVRFLQRTRGIAEYKPGEQQQPDPEKVPKANLNKHLRKQVAQLKTILRERQIADGIDRRTALKLEKRAALAQGSWVR